MRRCLCFIILFQTGFCILSAQQLSPTVITTDGGSSVAHGIQLDWTVGEPAIESATGTMNWYTEGFHQPILLVERIISTDNDSHPGDHSKTLLDMVDILVAPNPVSSMLVITIPADAIQPRQLQLIRQDGVAMLNRKIEINEANIEIDMSALAAGMYLLRFVSMDGEALSTFKISKIQ